MPVVRLSGRVYGQKDPNRKKRGELLYLLFESGWDIYNGNGDQVITLENIQKKIVESDAFVFMPGANIEDYFHATSIFVGYQTQDHDLDGKAALILNSDKSWNNLSYLIQHLHEMGTVKQDFTSFLKIVDKPKKVVKELSDITVNVRKTVSPEPDILEKVNGCTDKMCEMRKPDYMICVFCSASINKQEYLYDAHRLGQAIAKEGWGCITGAGCTGMMGQVTKGATETGGWTGGSNVPHIIALEGLPEGLNEFWPRADIYTRMEVMIRESHAFVIMPGGIGTIQELFAMLVLKQQGHDLMNGKEIIIVNRRDEKGEFFWDPLLHLLKKNNMQGMYQTVERTDDIIPLLRKIKKA